MVSGAASGTHPPQTKSRRWLSQDLSALMATPSETHSFDAVIVGSGYGGAMAAAELGGYLNEEGKPARICLLERGSEYTPGMFPSNLAELPKHIRARTTDTLEPAGLRTALLDFRLGSDVHALLANGLGGGSLINAGVLEKPVWSDGLDKLFPRSVVNDLDDAVFEAVKKRLGAKSGRGDNTIHEHEWVKHKPLTKTESLKTFAPPDAFHPAALSIAMKDEPNLKQCTLCGDCLTGCNTGAKKSLDTNLLHQASANQVAIYTGASVLSLERINGLWEIRVVYTDKQLNLRNPKGLVLKARKVILSAGSFGSPEILLRSQALSEQKTRKQQHDQADRLVFSTALGKQFSCNGDNLTAAYRAAQPTLATADEWAPVEQRRVGPTITGVLRFPAKGVHKSFLVEEFAVPAPIKRLFEEGLTTSAMLHQLADADENNHQKAVPTDSSLDPFAVQPDDINHSMMLGIIGHDAAEGTLRFPSTINPLESKLCEGTLAVQWPQAKNGRDLDDALTRLEHSAQAQQALQPGGRILPNPLWKMFPPNMDNTLMLGRGPVLTVHPLGGCAMSEKPSTGVVSEFGQVVRLMPTSNAREDALQPVYSNDLLVWDGSIIPQSLGCNPALTIAAVCQRAAHHMRDKVWKWRKDPDVPSNTLPPRPHYRTQDECLSEHIETEIEIIERLVGNITSPQGQRFVAEMTLCFEPTGVQSLISNLYRSLATRAASGHLKSELRLFDEQQWKNQRLAFANDVTREKAASYIAELQGSMELFNRAPSTAWSRRWQAGLAWFFTRGLRDTYQEMDEKWRGLHDRSFNFWQKLQDTWNLASRAGETRTLIYGLDVSQVIRTQKGMEWLPRGTALHGEKRLNYRWRSSPLQQLTELHMDRFGGTNPAQPVTFKLDNRFLADQGIPLVRITRQQDQIHALADLARLLGYLARMFVSIHLWTFRKPDAGSARAPTLLPGVTQGLPRPEVTELDVDVQSNGLPVKVRLTRYKPRTQPDSKRPANSPPMVFIHGYSAGGNTFTHDSIPLPMARYFHDQGRDIWVLDLRTSPGMPTATLPWRFEDVALADIPLAISYIRKLTGAPKVDVFAHCIGAVMISMAILTDSRNLENVTSYPSEQFDTAKRRYAAELDALPGSIRRLVLSQKGPALVYSQTNALRAYLMRSLRKLIVPDDFQFRTSATPSIRDQLLDRLLAGMPYPPQEIARENPLRPCVYTPWVGFRHRMDLLYGSDFNLADMTDETLASIEDLFGPINLQTVERTIHFVTHNQITNAGGRNVFVSPQRMKARWGQIEKTLSIHGTDNRLVDIETLQVMKDLMRRSDLREHFQTQAFEGFGHQDSLIGKRAVEIFEFIETHFLRK